MARFIFGHAVKKAAGAGTIARLYRIHLYGDRIVKKKTAVILGSIVLGLLLLAVIVPSFIDWSKYQSQAREILIKKTGFDVEIGGKLSMAILPTPRLKVEGVKLFEPNWKDRPVFTLGKAQVMVSPLSLLSGQVKVSSVQLEDAVVDLYVAQDGRKNWVVADKPQDEPSAPEAASGSTTDISLDEVAIRNATFKFEDAAAGSAQEVKLDTLNMSAQSLTGPFNAEGNLKYRAEDITFTAKSGRYEKGNSLPLSLTLKNKTGDMDISYSGVVDVEGDVEVQGEVAVAAAKLSGLASRLTGQPAPAAIAGIGALQVKGLLTASANGVWLNNAFLKVNDRKADVKLELSGFQNDILTVATTVEFSELFDADAFMGFLAGAAPSQGGAEASANGGTQNLLPARIELPKNVKANIHVAVPGLTYRGKETGQMRVGATYDLGTLTATLDAMRMPGETSLKAETTLKYNDVKQNGLQVVLEKPSFNGTVSVDTRNIRDVLVGWLGVVTAAQLPADMPNVVVMKTGLKIEGDTLRADILDANIGETTLQGFVQWQQRAGRPVLTADVKGGQLAVPDFSAGKAQAPEQNVTITEQKPAIPVLPFDANVKLDIQRLQYGERVFHGVQTDIKMTDKRLDVTKLAVGDHMGTAFAASGHVGDISKMGDLAVKADVSSKNIDTLLQGYGIKLPENLPSPIGALVASVQAKGSLDQAAFDATVKAYDFTVAANGTATNLLSPSLPPKLAFKVTHPNSARAIRFVSTSYRSDSPLMDKPLELSGDLLVSGADKSYNVSNLVFKLGPSTIKGKADVSMAGAVPSVSTWLAADNLPVSVLLGNAEKPGETGGQNAMAAGGTPWTRDAINTDGLRAVNADATITAEQFSFGNTVLRNASLKLTLKDGLLDVSKVEGALDQGTLAGKAQIRATDPRKPLEVTADMALSGATMASATKAMVGKASETLGGDVAFNVAVNANGISTAALMNSLAGQGQFNVDNPVLKGVDIKAMYESFKSLDNFRGSIGSFLEGTTSGGSTAFNSVQKNFQIVNGAINVDNWDVKADHATMISNGKIDFANWKIDLDNQIQIEGVQNLPSFGMRIYGPLNNPQKVFLRQSLEDFMTTRLGNKAQELIQEKIGSKIQDKLGVGLGDVLPMLGGAQNQAQPQGSTQGSTQGTGTEEAPVQQEQQNVDPRQQIFNGLMKELTR